MYFSVHNRGYFRDEDGRKLWMVISGDMMIENRRWCVRIKNRGSNCPPPYIHPHTHLNNQEVVIMLKDELIVIYHQHILIA